MKFGRKVAASVLNGPLYAKLHLQDWNAGRRLHLVQNNLGKLGTNDIALFTCIAKEPSDIPGFANYYRQLGVRHFIVVDDTGTSGLGDWASGDDMTVWQVNEDSRKGGKSSLWLNDLLRRYGVGRWNVIVSPQEFLVYPKMQSRSLKALSTFLDEERRSCLHAVALDFYPGPLTDTPCNSSPNPFETNKYFDNDSYIQFKDATGYVSIVGGPLLRRHFSERPEAAPILNRIPFIKWRAGYHLDHDTHRAFPNRLNKAHSPGVVSMTGALARFGALPDQTAFEPGISVQYRGPEQLVDLGLMCPGRWF